MEMSSNVNGSTIFYSDGITVDFGGLRALNDVSISIGENEIRGLIGPNGAGKSTFFNVVTGYVKSTSGQTFFQGEDISNLGPHEVAKRGVIRTFQKRGIVPGLTVLENVLIGYHRLLPEMWLWHIGLRLRKFKILEKQAIDMALGAIESVGLHDCVDQLAGDLSFGQQTLVEIARALTSRPKLLLLDEPAAGLSSSEMMHVSELLKGLAQTHGVSLMISDHTMDFIMDVCQNLSVLNFGQILAEGTYEYIRQHPHVLEAYIGTG